MYVFEQYIDDWIHEYGNKDKIAFDLGAHIGAYSFIMSPLFKEVYSFEPHPLNIMWIKKNIKRLDIQNITVIEKAVSNYTGFCRLYTHAIHSSEHSISLDLVSSLISQGSLIFSEDIYKNVNCITLDDFCQETKKIPSFIKCDVEGAEEFIFQGATNLLKNNDIVIGLEVHSIKKHAFLSNFFINLGYKIYNQDKKEVKNFDMDKICQSIVHYLIKR